MQARRFLLPPLLLVLAPFLLAAGPGGGAGGILFSIDKPDLAASYLPSLGATGSVEQVGGFGYGVDREGFVIGGFGTALLDQAFLVPAADLTGALAGGIGGMIVGQRLVDGRRLDLDLGLRLGLGGIARDEGAAWKGWAVAMIEPYAEILIAVAPWMALSARLGYQVLGNFAPGLTFQDFFVRTPLLGFAISWGDFRP